jgi:hypothetical protein
LDSRRTRQRVGLQQFALRVKARFTPFRDSAGYTIVMRWQRRLKSCFSEDQALFLETRTRHGSRFSGEHLSPGDEPACHPQPKSLRRVERNPFNVGGTIWQTTGFEPIKRGLSTLLRTDAQTQVPTLTIPLPESITAERLARVISGFLGNLSRPS